MYINTAHHSRRHVIMWLTLGFFPLIAVQLSTASITAGYVDHGDMKGECGCGCKNMILGILSLQIDNLDKYL